MMHASRPRNRLIAQALYDRGVIEYYGRGIKRIKEECDRNGNPYPDWTDRPGEFLTIYKTRGSQDTEVGGKAPEVGPKSEEVGGKAQVLEPTDTAFKNAMRLGAKFLL